jgi:C-terminal processing protease CtpA/Prc
MKLSRVWNAVRFSSATLSEDSPELDAAALMAIQSVLTDPSATARVADDLVNRLLSPAAFPIAEKDGAETHPTYESRNGAAIERVSGFASVSTEDAFVASLLASIGATSDNDGLVIDLRAAEPPSVSQIAATEEAWAKISLASRVSRDPLSIPVPVRRYYIGFPSEFPQMRKVYSTAIQAIAAIRSSSPDSRSKNLRIAFVTNKNSIVPDDALALEAAGRARFYSDDGRIGLVGGLPVLQGLQILRAASDIAQPIPTVGFAKLPRPSIGTANDALRWASGTDTPTVPSISDVVPMSDGDYPDLTHRILAVFRIWGAIRYAYPYLTGFESGWDKSAAKALSEVADSGDALAYDLSILRFYANLKDTHGFAFSPTLAAAFAGYPPFASTWVDDRVVVTAVQPGASIRVGDVVLAIDGQPVADRAEKMTQYINASTSQSLRDMLLTGGHPSVFAGPIASSMRISIERAGRAVGEETVARIAKPISRVASHAVVAMLPGQIAYIDLVRLTVDSIPSALQEIAPSRALIFDLRGYPQGTVFALAPHFSRQKILGALFKTPIISFSSPQKTDLATFEYPEATQTFLQTLAPEAPYYGKPITVLINADAVSQSEHTALFIRAAAKPTFVGEPTAGADGEVTALKIPGRMALYFSGQAVYFPDGSPLQRRGIIPDENVSTKVADVASGADDILLAGLANALRRSGSGPADVERALSTERAFEEKTQNSGGT